MNFVKVMAFNTILNIFSFFVYNRIGDIMKNKNLYIILTIIGILILIGVIFFITNFNKNTEIKNNKNNNYNVQYESKKIISSENISNEINKKASSPIEKEISSFSTKVLSNDEARQNNMNITAKKLNNYIVKNDETFSFCSVLGPSTSKDGYKEADIFDNNGKKKKGLGGGNCQISTTLYNALLSIPNIKIIERNSHSNYVPYIEKGKDAAVAYGSLDFKFRNNTGKDIKLVFEVNTNNVTVKIIEISKS